MLHSEQMNYHNPEHDLSRQQVHYALQELGFSDVEIESGLNQCRQQGMIYTVEWIVEYLKYMRSHPRNASTSSSSDNEENLHTNQQKRLIYLSDMNDIIFGDSKCDRFGNVHHNGQSELILEILNKIYDLLFDFFYEQQLESSNQRTKRNSGYSGRLSPNIIESILSDLIIEQSAYYKFASILKMDSLFTSEYSRNDFNILFRLISMYQSGVNESFMSISDYQMSIVQLPDIKIPHGFINYLNKFCPNWSSPEMKSSKQIIINRSIPSKTASKSTQISNQYDLGAVIHSSKIYEEAKESELSFSENETADFFKTYREKVDLKAQSESVINLNGELQEEVNRNSIDTRIIFRHLFAYYSSKLFAHTFIDDGYIPQDQVVEILISSKLSQRSLEIIWNEAKQHNENRKVQICGSSR